MSLARRRRLVEVARERELLILEDNPYGLLRYEGEPLPTLYSLDAEAVGRGGTSDLVIYLGTFSKILSPGLRLGWAVAPRPVLEKLNLGKQGADLCSSSVTQTFVAAYFQERAAGALPRWQAHLERLRDLYRLRRDAMLEALEEHFGEGASWTRPQGGLFIWATLDARIDTTDLLALAQKSESVAFVPGRAAYVDGRSGSSSMRLNFAGMSEEDIREGVRRIGARSASSSACSGRSPARPRPPRPRRAGDTAAEAGQPPAANVVELPRRDDRARRTPHARSMSDARSVAVLKGGRSLERAVSLRSGAHVQEALLRLGHEVRGDRRGAAARGGPLAARPDAAFIAVHGRDGEDGTIQQLLDALGIAYTGSGPAACMRSTNKVLAKHLMREAGIPTPAFHAFRRRRSGARRAAPRWRASRRTSASRWWSSPRAAAPRSG